VVSARWLSTSEGRVSRDTFDGDLKQ